MTKLEREVIKELLNEDTKKYAEQYNYCMNPENEVTKSEWKKLQDLEAQIAFRYCELQKYIYDGENHQFIKEKKASR